MMRTWVAVSVSVDKIIPIFSIIMLSQFLASRCVGKFQPSQFQFFFKFVSGLPALFPFCTYLCLYDLQTL